MLQTRTYRLLTGATGLVGSQLLARLMKRHVPVCVLVRPQGAVSATERIEQTLRRFETAWQQRLARPVVVQGDLCEQGLGLSAADQKMIAANCSSVIHVAASLRFRPASESPTNEPYRTNVEGTRQLLTLCSASGIDDFHYVSSAYVCGASSTAFREDQRDTGQTFSNDYEHSKVLAETMVSEWPRLRSTFYRPSIVIDTTGNSPISEDRTLYVALSMYRNLSAKFGHLISGSWFELLGLDGTERKNLVEAAWVATLIDQIVDERTLHGATYHLVASEGTLVSEIENAFQQVVTGTAPGSTDIGRPPNEPTGKAASYTKRWLGRGTRAIAQTMAGPYLDTFAPYFRNDPKFDRANLLQALDRLGIRDAEKIDSAKLIQFASLQGAPESSSSAHNGPQAIQETTQSDCDWTEWFQRMHSMDGGEQLNLAGDFDPWGVCLVGTGGGDWLLSRSPLRVLKAGQRAERLVYTDVPTWDLLVAQRLTVVQAMKQGRLLIEFEASENFASANSRAEQVLVQSLNDLLNEVRQQALAPLHEAVR